MNGMAEGTLLGPEDCVTVTTATPSRALMLAAMQQRGISLSNHDVVTDRNYVSVPVEQFWSHSCAVGGVCQVGGCGGGWGRVTTVFYCFIRATALITSCPDHLLHVSTVSICRSLRALARPSLFLRRAAWKGGPFAQRQLGLPPCSPAPPQQWTLKPCLLACHHCLSLTAMRCPGYPCLGCSAVMVRCLRCPSLGLRRAALVRSLCCLPPA